MKNLEKRLNSITLFPPSFFIFDLMSSVSISDYCLTDKPTDTRLKKATCNWTTFVSTKQEKLKQAGDVDFSNLTDTSETLKTITTRY